MKRVTIPEIMNFDPCYSEYELEHYVPPNGITASQVLAADVSMADKLWALTRPGLFFSRRKLSTMAKDLGGTKVQVKEFMEVLDSHMSFCAFLKINYGEFRDSEAALKAVTTYFNLQEKEK